MKKKNLLIMLSLCVAAMCVAGALVVNAVSDDDKNGEFNGLPAHVDDKGNLYIDEVNFPDEIFKNVVSEVDTNGDGMLSESEADEVVEIDCSHKKIESLDGIGYFAYLQFLDCSGNALTTLDISACTVLDDLDCSDNALVSLNLSTGTYLHTLDCSGNALTSLDLSVQRALLHLYCNGNKLEKLDISESSVFELGVDFELLSGNRIIYNVDEPPTLVVYALSVNEKTEGVYTVDLSEYFTVNYIGALNITSVRVFEYADDESLGSEEIKDYSYDPLTGILTYNDPDRHMSSERGTTESWEQTWQLSLEGTLKKEETEWKFYTKIDQTAATSGDGKNGTFNGSPAAVDEEGNLLLNSTNFPDEKFLDAIKGYLDRYDTDGNGAFSEAEISKMTHIYVDSEGISDVSGICYFTSLTELHCSENSISELDLSKNTALEHLECDSNDLSELDLNNNTALYSIYCSHNNLSKLDVSKNTKLIDLFCSYNNITELDFSENQRLSSLDCSYNAITELDLSQNTDLWSLNCSYTGISELDLSKCERLHEINIERTSITELDLSNCSDVSLFTLGDCVSFEDIKLHESASPEFIDMTVYSHFDEKENVWKVDFEKYVDIIKTWCTDALATPFVDKVDPEAMVPKDEHWYVDDFGKSVIENPGLIWKYPPYGPDSAWTKYEDGAIFGVDLDEHPEHADYYKNNVSYVIYDKEYAAVGFVLFLHIVSEPVINNTGDTDVTVEYPKNEREDYIGVSLNAEGLTEGSEYDAAEKALGSEYTDIVPYSLTLTDKDGKPVSVKSKLTVSVPVPEGWEAGKTLVFYIDGEGNAVDMNAKATEDGKFVTFETTHFSTYALVNAATKTETPPAETDPVETDPTETEPETTPVETEPAATEPAETTPDTEGGKGESEPPQTGDFGAAILPAVVAVSVLGIGITAVSVKSRAGRK